MILKCPPIALNSLRTEGIEIAEQQMAENISGGPDDIRVQTKDGSVFKGTHLLIACGPQGEHRQSCSGQGGHRA